MSAVYNIITDRIIAMLESGTVPWQKPWRSEIVNGVRRYVMPHNLTSKKAYSGINVFLLCNLGYHSRYFLTYKQAQEMGGSVRKGEHGFPVIFWKKLDKPSAETGEDGKKGLPFILRYYTVFNVEQCEGIEVPDKPAPVIVTEPAEPVAELPMIEAAEALVSGYKLAPSIAEGEAQAYYRPATDHINMPKRSLFNSAEEWYSTLFHEMAHSTGHKSRLNRSTLADMCRFGDTNYSKEELVAEMGAAFLCAMAGIENKTINNSAAYLKGWLSKLKSDPKLIVQAAAQAQKAADYIQGKAKPQEATERQEQAA